MATPYCTKCSGCEACFQADICPAWNSGFVFMEVPAFDQETGKKAESFIKLNGFPPFKAE